MRPKHLAMFTIERGKIVNITEVTRRRKGVTPKARYTQCNIKNTYQLKLFVFKKIIYVEVLILHFPRWTVVDHGALDYRKCPD
jgi:hypothetical protein